MSPVECVQTDQDHPLINSFALNALRMIVGEPHRHRLQQGIEGEVCRQFHDETWSLMLEEPNAIAAILYACGASGANSAEFHCCNLQICG